MGLRLSTTEAKRLGISLSDSTVGRGKSALKSPAQKLAAAKKRNSTGVGSPQYKLEQACLSRFPQAIAEFKNAVPERQFRIDIAFEKERLAVEVDGWMYHGKYLADFKRDREKQNLLTLNGWRILRFTASDIHNQLPDVLQQIEAAIMIGGPVYE